MIRKILFISHEASRTGAPLILLHLLKWLNKNTENLQFDVLLIKRGAMADDFRKDVCLFRTLQARKIHRNSN